MERYYEGVPEEEGLRDLAGSIAGKAGGGAVRGGGKPGWQGRGMKKEVEVVESRVPNAGMLEMVRLRDELGVP